MAVEPIIRGENVLLVAPTGTGKTEAAFLPVLNNFLKNHSNVGVHILYIMPLMALNRNMFKRFLLWRTRLGIRVEVRARSGNC